MNKQAAQDRMLAVTRAKDQIKNKMLQEMDRMRKKLKQEHKQELGRLQNTIRKQEEELCHLRTERKLYVKPELENIFDRVERIIVNKINEECRRNSGILGNNPRKVNSKNFQVDNRRYTRNGRHRTPNTATLANLRACNQDVRNNVTELKRELGLQKTALMRVEKEKDDVVQKVKQQIEVEKNKELEKMKQSVVKQILALKYNGYSVHKTQQSNAIQQETGVNFSLWIQFPGRDTELRNLKTRKWKMINQTISKEKLREWTS